MGARIYNYLLEKSRIPNPAKDERNYHIFYHLLKSDDPENLIAVGLKGKKPKDFNYLNMSGCEEVKTVDDESLYIEVSQSFKVKTHHYFKYLILIRLWDFQEMKNNQFGIWYQQYYILGI